MSPKVWLLIGCLAVAVGCGGESKYPVSGTVTYKGKPVPDVNVTMVRSDGVVASAKTDSSGAFANVTTEMPNDGAPAGDYNVGITPVSTVTSNPTSADAYAMPPKPPFPTKYLSPDGSGLQVTVSGDDGEQTVDLELTD